MIDYPPPNPYIAVDWVISLLLLFLLLLCR